MAKGGKKVDWVKATALGLLGVIVLGAAGFGIYKLVQHIQDKKAGTEQAEVEKDHGAGSESVQARIDFEANTCVVEV